jgi:hypothetical protein
VRVGEFLLVAHVQLRNKHELSHPHTLSSPSLPAASSPPCYHILYVDSAVDCASSGLQHLLPHAKLLASALQAQVCYKFATICYKFATICYKFGCLLLLPPAPAACFVWQTSASVLP